MRSKWLLVFAFVLTCCGATAAQQNVLVLKDDKDDPCSRFKMRILAPAEDGDYKLRVRQPAENIDPQMIWNPCPRNESQVAQLIIPFMPDYRGKFFVQPPNKIQPLVPKQSDSKNLWETDGQGLPPAIELMRKR